MDNLRGTFDSGLPADESQDWEADNTAPDEENVREMPPEAIGQDERRMQVRAYNHWASLLGDATFPSIEDLEPQNLTDFGPNSVLLDFSTGIEDPVVQYLGNKLADECGAEGLIERLSDVPPRSLLSRITDHYMQILANQAPIGFEAEFVNQRGASILYRGILLPFSSDDETIDFIYGVINWKEMADAATADELLLEIDQALEASDDEEPVEEEDLPHKHHTDEVVEWADSPAQEDDVPSPEITPEFGTEEVEEAEFEPVAEAEDDNVSSFEDSYGSLSDGEDLPLPDFGQYGLDEPEVDEFGEEIEEEDGEAGYSFASLSDYIQTPTKKVVDLDANLFDPEDYSVEEPADETSEESPEEAPEAEYLPEPSEPEAVEAEPVEDVLEVDQVYEEPDADQTIEEQPQISEAVEAQPLSPAPVEPEQPLGEMPEDAGLYDFLASARELAQNAKATEDRSRTALYAAVGRAYDFSLAAQESPEEYNELIEDSGLTVQERAPMTPIVKLVFGHDYDKTRLTEYAAVLSHAHRMEIERGSLGDYLGKVEGGLKGVVAAERRLRREEAGKVVEDEGEVRAALAKKLRELEEMLLEELSGKGPEFSLVMVRRDDEGNVALIGEIDDDVKLIERAGKRLVG